MKRRLLLGGIVLSGLVSAAAGTATLLTARSALEEPWPAVFTLGILTLLGGAAVFGGVALLLWKGVRSTRRSVATQFYRIRRIDERLRDTMHGVKRMEKALRDTDVSAFSSSGLELILDTRVAEMLAGMQAISSQQAELRRAFATEILEEVLELQERASADYRQVEALLAIYSAIGVRAPLPPFRAWAISPDCGAYLVATLVRERPSLVVETGSGVSTLLMGTVLEDLGGGRLVSLEHDHDSAIAIQSSLAVHGLDGRVEVREAPLSEIELDGMTYEWYDHTSVDDLRDIDVLFVDGPPLLSSPSARYPALPVLYERLSTRAVVLADDALRDESRSVIDRWRQEFPQLTTRVLEHEKGTAEFILSRS